MNRILIVDDETNILESLKESFQREGFHVSTAIDGEEAVIKAQNINPDLILLDCMLPKMSGIDVLKILRQSMTMPIIMLTAKSEEIDKVLGLELGADDYITKPFSVREVIARCKAQIRRIHMADKDSSDGNRIIKFDDLEFDFDTFAVRRNGQNLHLTMREFDLVAFLVRHRGQVFSREELLQQVWDYEYYGDVRTVDVTVRRTREKIEPNPDEYKYIITKRGVGYYFERSDDEDSQEGES